MKRPLLMILIGLAVRELLATFTGHPWDLEVFARVGYYVANGSSPYVLLQPIEGITFSLYGNMTSVGYPPIWPLFCGLAYLAYNSLSTLDPSPLLYYFLLKQPAIVGDILCGVISSKFSDDPKKSAQILGFWLFNPLVIIISSVWGMFDSLPILLTLVALLMILRKKDDLAGISLGFASILKVIPGIFTPIFYLASRVRHQFFIAFSISAALSIVLPFFLFGWPINGFVSAMGSQAVNIRDYPATGGLTAFSVFEAVNSVLPGAFSGAFLSAISYLWIFAFAAFYVVVFIRHLRRPSGSGGGKADPDGGRYGLAKVLRLSILAATIFLLTRPWVSESYVLYLLAFMLIEINTAGQGDRGAFRKVWLLAILFLVINNTFMIRFLSPVSETAFHLDVAINNSQPFGAFRTALKVALSFLFFFVLIGVFRSYASKAAPPQSALHKQPSKADITYGICAYNEEKNIGHLLDNLVNSQPLGDNFHLMEILVVSSGSTDSTDAIVRGKSSVAPKIRLITEPRRTGKSSAQNIILREAKGDIIVMISADALPAPGSIKELVSAIGGNVGASSGRAVPINKGKLVGFASQFIWQLHHETNIFLTKAGSLSHLGGDMIAIRAGLVKNIPPEIVNDDAFLGISIKRQGYLLKNVPQATVWIRGPATVTDFLDQRRRILYGHRQIKNSTGSSSTTFWSLALLHPASALSIFVNTCRSLGAMSIVKVPIAISLELTSYLLSLKGDNYLLWKRIGTTKDAIGRGSAQ